ncbi:hypothetical protein JL721_2741 [Aureococcus anophagefferens]|nr:hypothetical protein JL721_2741 [Aureococcus anophagefferens]
MASFAATEQAAFVLPDAADVLESATPALTSFRVVVTPHRFVKVILHYQAGYPATAAVVEVRNPAYPPPLLKKILAAEDAAAAAAAEGRGALAPVAAAARAFLEGNRFVPCWRELRRCALLCERRGGGMAGANPAKGVARFAAKTGAYAVEFSVTVPADYPAAGVELAVRASDFSRPLVDVQLAQVRELVRRCAAGADVDAAKRLSDPVAASAARLGAGDDRGPRRPAGALSIAEAGHEGAEEDRGPARRRRGADEARRPGPRPRGAPGREAGAEDARALRGRDAGARALSATAAEAAAAPPVPSLFAAVEALVDDFAAGLPEETCQCCGARVLPEDPAFPAAAGDEPTRALCGHWFHYACLEKALTVRPSRSPAAPANGARGTRPGPTAKLRRLARAERRTHGAACATS